ncbi:MAG: TatD family hydrolase [Verrucomicrobia bacterium]|nr:TatD family hydrolase [Verrucomicrobiota bacterium]
MLPLYDAHNHLHDEWLAPHLDHLAADLAAVGLAGAVVNGTTPADWPEVAALAARFAWVVPSYGVHPWDCGNRPADWLAQLEARLAAEPRARIGEIGLDRWMLDRAKPDDPRLAGLRRAPLDEQTEVFTQQLALAARRNLAASVHCIDAWGALLDTLRTARLPARGFLLHAYAGPVEMISPFADLGAYFSFNGAFLDPKRTSQRAAFASVPPDRLLVETDAPAMTLRSHWRTHDLPDRPDATPVNHPANIAAVYTGLADHLGQPLPALATQVEANFKRLFQ